MRLRAHCAIFGKFWHGALFLSCLALAIGLLKSAAFFLLALPRLLSLPLILLRLVFPCLLLQILGLAPGRLTLQPRPRGFCLLRLRLLFLYFPGPLSQPGRCSASLIPGVLLFLLLASLGSSHFDANFLWWHGMQSFVPVDPPRQRLPCLVPNSFLLGPGASRNFRIGKRCFVFSLPAAAFIVLVLAPPFHFLLAEILAVLLDLFSLSIVPNRDIAINLQFLYIFLSSLLAHSLDNGLVSLLPARIPALLSPNGKLALLGCWLPQYVPHLPPLLHL